MNIIEQIEQLELAAKILRSKEAGEPVEWQTKTGEIWYSVTQDYCPMEYLRHNTEIRLKPWTLGRSVNGHTLPDGEARWHRQDWTQGMLPALYRPLMVGEGHRVGDEYRHLHGGVETWVKCSFDHDYPKPNYSVHYRTTRPIPVVGKWAAERAAFAEGKRVKYRFLMGDKEWSRWKRINREPAWIEDGSHEYMVEPEPVFIDLGPEDVPIGSALYDPNWPAGTFEMILGTETKSLRYREGTLPYSQLRRDGWLIQRPSKPGVWERCEKPSP